MYVCTSSPGTSRYKERAAATARARASYQIAKVRGISIV